MLHQRYLVVALLSAGLLSMEMTWTRIFSAEFFYSFAFLILSLAILGLGLGALAVRMWPKLDSERSAGIFLSLTGLMCLIGPPLVFQIELNFARLFVEWTMVGKFLLVVMLLNSSFFFGGIVLAWYFRHYNADMPRVYMADLIGAAGGVFFAISLMNVIGTPVSTFITAAPILAAAFIVNRKRAKLFPACLVLLMLVLSVHSDRLLEAARQERAPVIYKHWDALAKLKMYDYGGHFRGINIDNLANSPVIPFDGDWESFRADSVANQWDINVKYLIDQFAECTFLSLGAGGGADVMQALAHDAAEIHAVEVNPHINKMLLKGDPSGYTVRDSSVTDSLGQLITVDRFTGHIYDDPRVVVVSEDARAYTRRFADKFDLIFSLSSNTWAALGSGSFAFAENYLFTTEAFQDYWTALSENGFLVMEHQVYMPRLVSQVLDGLFEMGVPNPEKHIAVYNLPALRRNLLLMSKQPLNETIITNAFGPITAANFEKIHLLYPAADSLEPNLVSQIIQKGWKSVADSAKIDISPCRDNRPFIAQMGLLKNFSFENLQKASFYTELFGFPLSKTIIISIILILTILILPFNLIPYLISNKYLKPTLFLYFLLIGMAFMMIEIVLIQKYALFIGASVYSISTVMLTLLLFSGIGSLFSQKVRPFVSFSAIVLFLLFDIIFFPVLIPLFKQFEILQRVFLTAVLLAPLSFFMGMPFPIGAKETGELIDWGFAVNGAASVIGSALVMLIAFQFGFVVALLIGAIFYILAYLMLWLTH